MQELTNDYYSEIKIHNIFHIAYKAIEFSTKKKNQQLHSRSQYWNDNEAAPVMADSCIRRISHALSLRIFQTLCNMPVLQEKCNYQKERNINKIKKTVN